VVALPPFELPPDVSRLWLGVSGGVDSVALLHWVSELRPPGLEVRVLHVNHGLSAQADRWQALVEQLCDERHLPLEVAKVVVKSAGKGIEDAARLARYVAFEGCLVQGDALVLAHHLNDQAETLLLRLLRGAGVEGLAAMRTLRPLGAGVIWRPWLDVARNTIETYAAVHRLPFVQDESNQDCRYRRNFLRTQIMPQLGALWPQAASLLARTASHAAEAQQLLDSLAATDWHGLSPRAEKLGQSICVPSLLALNVARQKNCLRWAGKRIAGHTPSEAQLGTLLTQLDAKVDAQMAVVWQDANWVWHRAADRLFWVPRRLAAPVAQPVALGQTVLADGSQLSIQCATPISGQLRIGYRQGGERAHPRQRAHSQQLKKLLQEYGVPAWLRARVPLLYAEDQLWAVGDYWLEQAAPADLQLAWYWPDAGLTPDAS
jgi:tRNA(Ile)-lysidine synthase